MQYCLGGTKIVEIKSSWFQTTLPGRDITVRFNYGYPTTVKSTYFFAARFHGIFVALLRIALNILSIGIRAVGVLIGAALEREFVVPLTAFVAHGETASLQMVHAVMLHIVQYEETKVGVSPLTRLYQKASNDFRRGLPAR